MKMTNAEMTTVELQREYQTDVQTGLTATLVAERQQKKWPK
ncbi:hypothetical protein [Secundilactobacillus kimchicus]|nr:hypothetical protein [Secundilactobacillus kimchicus]